MLLVISFAMLVLINLLERWSKGGSALPETAADARPAVAGRRVRQAQQDPAWVRWGLTLAAAAVVGVLIVIPVVHVFAGALSEACGVYWDNLFGDPDTRHSILLTLTVVPLALVANVVFGVAAAWAIARFRFPGRTVLTALIDLPFSVSPVVAGLMFVLIFGLQGYFGPFLRRDGYAIMPYLTSLRGAPRLFVDAAGLPLTAPRGPQARHRRDWPVSRAGPAAFALLLGRPASTSTSGRATRASRSSSPRRGWSWPPPS